MVLDDRLCEYSTDGFCVQAEDGIRDLVRSRGLGDVYKRQALLNQKLTPDIVEDPETLKKLGQLIRSFFNMGGHLSLIHI